MSVTILLPSSLIRKHGDIFLVSLCLFLIGFMFGTRPQYSQPIIEEAQKTTLNPENTSENFRLILFNNAFIAFIATIGGIIFIPTVNIAIRNIGMTYGAVISTSSIGTSAILLGTFGLLEASAFLLSITSALLFPKYILQKLTGRLTSISETTVDALMLFIYAILILIPSAILEATLINPQTQSTAIIVGVLTTIIILYILWRP